MRTYKFLGAVAFMTLTSACGADEGAQLGGNMNSTTDAEHALHGDSGHVSAATKQRVFTAFVQLEKSGALSGEGVWRMGKHPPADLEFASVTLRNDADRGIMDGFAHIALIPSGTRGQIDRDPNKATHFYLQRTGGFAGATFFAGPFALPTSSGIVISESDHERVIDVTKGTPLTVSLAANPSTGFTWSVKAEPALPAPQQEYVPTRTTRIGAGGTSTFTWDTQDPAFVPNTVYTLTFTYGRAWQPDTARTFVVSVRVVE